MNILSVENLSKTLDEKPLFENVNLGLDSSSRVGIVGKNGSGKSTLLRVLNSTLPPDEGRVAVKKDLNIITLEQKTIFKKDDTLSSFFLSSPSKRIKTLSSYYEELNKGNEKEVLRLSGIIEEENIYDDERAFYSILTDLNENLESERKLTTLSGGELKKVALARALSSHPDLLLLDEVTNHLDIQTIEYVESWINKFNGALIIVTHDRAFLNNVVTTIWEIDRGRVYTHPGSYSEYLERKEERILQNEREQRRIESILRREKEWILRAPKARGGKDKNRIERFNELEKKVGDVREKEQKEFSSTFSRLGKKILDVKNLSYSYPNHIIFSSFSYSFKKGDRIGLVGPNGSGKSTFLNLLTSRLEIQEGVIDKGVNTIFSYFDQNERLLDEELTVLEYAEKIGKRIRLNNEEEVSASRFLELFSIPIKLQRSKISFLSGGERRRLYLITRLLSSPNFLVLDEPTNDLDIETIENLEDYINNFEGVVLISSHDRTFLDLTTTTTFRIEGNEIKNYPYSYSFLPDLEENKKEEKSEKKIENRVQRVKKGLTFKEKEELKELNDEIEILEKDIKELEESFSDISKLSTLKERNILYEEKKFLLEEKTERWFFLEEKNQES